MARLEVPQGQFDLERVPPSADPSLQAWDGADRYLLEEVADRPGLPADGWLLVDDTFGALGVALADRHPQSWSDSVLAHRAVAANLARNGLDPAAVRPVPSVALPAGPVRVALVKVPRSLAVLDDRLRRLRPLLAEDAVVVAAGMTRHVHTSTIATFEAVLGPTPTSRARRKARLLLPTLDPRRTAPAPRPPARWSVPAAVAGHEVTVVARPDAFSHEALDLGTRALLEHLPDLGGAREVVDLGCGSGILGTVVASRWSGTEVTFVDASYGAVASAQDTFAATLPGRAARFVVGDALEGLDDASVDAVVCNPPFHAQGARGDDTALRMFRDARRVLRAGGRLVVVGNRHLGYHAALDRIFGAHEVVGATAKFVLLQATRR